MHRQCHLLARQYISLQSENSCGMWECIAESITASAFIFCLLVEICGDKTIADGVVLVLLLKINTKTRRLSVNCEVVAKMRRKPTNTVIAARSCCSWRERYGSHGTDGWLATSATKLIGATERVNAAPVADRRSAHWRTNLRSWKDVALASSAHISSMSLNPCLRPFTHSSKSIRKKPETMP